MPKINRMRIVNFKYNNDNRSIQDEVFDFRGGEHALLNLSNGGGKSVITQLFLQPSIPNARLAKRRMKGYFLGKNTAHVMIEWLLDNRDEHLLTGICFKKGSDDDLGYFSFTSLYHPGEDTITLDNVPIVDSEGKAVIQQDLVYKNLKELQDNRFKVYHKSARREYIDSLLDYGISEDEWKLIRKINESEGGLLEVFEVSKTSKAVMENWIIPAVEETMRTEDGRFLSEGLSANFLKHYESFAAIKKSIDTMRLYKSFKADSAAIPDVVGEYRQKREKREDTERQLGLLGSVAKREMESSENEKDELRAALAEKEIDIENLKYLLGSAEWKRLCERVLLAKQQIEKVEQGKEDVQEEIKQIDSELAAIQIEAIRGEMLEVEEKIVSYQESIRTASDEVDPEEMDNLVNTLAKGVVSLEKMLKVDQERRRHDREKEQAVFDSLDDKEAALKEKIEGEKKEFYQAQGKREFQIARLKKEFGSVDFDYQNKLRELQKDIQDAKDEMQQAEDQLENLSIELDEVIDGKTSLVSNLKNAATQLAEKELLMDEYVEDEAEFRSMSMALFETEGTLCEAFLKRPEEEIPVAEIALLNIASEIRRREEKALLEKDPTAVFNRSMLRLVEDLERDGIGLISLRKDVGDVLDVDAYVIEDDRYDEALSRINSESDFGDLLFYLVRLSEKERFVSAAKDVVKNQIRSFKYEQESDEELQKRRTDLMERLAGLRAHAALIKKLMKFEDEEYDDVELEIEKLSGEVDEAEYEIEESDRRAEKIRVEQSAWTREMESAKKRCVQLEQLEESLAAAIKEDVAGLKIGFLVASIEESSTLMNEVKEKKAGIESKLARLDAEEKKATQDSKDRIKAISSDVAPYVRESVRIGDSKLTIGKVEEAYRRFKSLVGGGENVTQLKEMVDLLKRNFDEKASKVIELEKLLVGETPFEGLAENTLESTLLQKKRVLGAHEDAERALNKEVIEAEALMRDGENRIEARYGKRPLKKIDRSEDDLRNEVELMAESMSSITGEISKCEQRYNVCYKICLKVESAGIEMSLRENGSNSEVSFEKMESEVLDLIKALRVIKKDLSEDEKRLSGLFSKMRISYGSCGDMGIESFVGSLLNKNVKQGEIDPDVIKSKFEVMNENVDRLIENHSIKYKEIEVERDMLIDQLSQYVVAFYDEIRTIDARSTIEMDGELRKMMKIQMPSVTKYEARERICSYVDEKIDEFVEQKVSGVPDDRVARAVEDAVHPRNLIDAIVGLKDVVVKSWKIDINRDNSYYKKWEDVIGTSSGGERFVAFFSVYVALLSHMRAFKKAGAASMQKDGKVLVMDNPFGPISSKHLLRPLFEVANSYNVQLICLTDLKQNAIYENFNLIYGLNIRKAVGGNKERLVGEVIKESIEKMHVYRERLS